MFLSNLTISTFPSFPSLPPLLSSFGLTLFADFKGDNDPLKVNRIAAWYGKINEEFELAYTFIKVIGNGSFGVVYQAKLINTGEEVAIKKVLQDKRFKVRMHLWF